MSSLGKREIILIVKIFLYYYREVSMHAGAKLIFHAYGDYPPFNACYSYLGEVGSAGQQPTGAEGQTVHIHSQCINLGTVVHLVLHSLG